MALLMTLSSFSFFMPSNLQVLYHLTEKCAIAWFAFAAVEGVRHTRSLSRYLIRLYSLAGIVFLGNIVLNTGFSGTDLRFFHNAILSLALGASVLGLMKIQCKKEGMDKIIGIISVCFLSLIGLACENGYIVIPVMIISYLLYHKPQLRDKVLMAFSILLCLSSIPFGAPIAEITNTLIERSGFLFVLVVPFLHLYSGERGTTSHFCKYFFYFYYPLHLWAAAALIYFIS